MNFFRHFTVKKTMLPCLLRGSLAYIFSGLLINVQYVRRVCGKIASSYVSKFLVYRGKILNGSEIFLMLIFFQKKIHSPREQYTSLRDWRATKTRVFPL